MWQFVGALLGLLALGAYWLGRSRRDMTWELLSSSPLVRGEGPLRQRLQVRFDDQPVDDVRFMLIRITNSGNSPILLPDYVEALSISTEREGNFLHAELAQASPSSLVPAFELQPERIMIRPTLLNGGDSFTLGVVTTGVRRRDVRCSARIAGVREVRRARDPSLGTLVLPSLGLALAVVGFVLLPKGSGASKGVEEMLREVPAAWQSWGLVVLGYVLMLVGVMRSGGYRTFIRRILNPQTLEGDE